MAHSSNVTKRPGLCKICGLTKPNMVPGALIRPAILAEIQKSRPSFVLLWKPFDPYPFILLNLVLSSLAAPQAPVIMMSQNRQEAKDRLGSENDYRVNLKAELEIQQVQLELMGELVAFKRRP